MWGDMFIAIGVGMAVTGGVTLVESGIRCPGLVDAAIRFLAGNTMVVAALLILITYLKI
jgi:hypothetical protein